MQFRLSSQVAVHIPFSTPGADVTRLRMLDLDAGKGRQVMKCVRAAT